MYPLTIVIDGNYLFYKTLGITKGYSKVYNEENKYLNNSKDVGIFIRKVANDLSYTLQQFSGFEKIVFTKDTRSWRKDIKIPIKDHPGYKGSRKGQNDVNMKVFFKVMDDFCEILKKNGVIISQIPTAEGDDLMYLWSNYLNKKENPENVIIFTGDGDISQMVNFNENVYTVIFSNRSAKNIKLIAKVGFKEWLKSKEVKSNDNFLNMFNQNSLNKIMGGSGIDVINLAITKIPMEEIDPLAVSLEKILCGDDGDDIPSSWHWINDKGRKIRITNKHFKKVYEYLIHKDGIIDIYKLINDDKYKNRIRLKIQDVSKITIPKDEYFKRLVLNTKLAFLDSEQFPENILNEFNSSKINLLETKKINHINRIDLLKGTPYEKKEIDIESDLFKIM